jgi:hypothetical protein
MAKEYKNLTFIDSPSGRQKMSEVIDQLANEGWELKSKETSQQNYGFVNTCCLGCIFLPLALLGKKKNSIAVVMEREIDPNRKESTAIDNKIQTKTDFYHKPWHKTWWGILIIIFISIQILAVTIGSMNKINQRTQINNNQTEGTSKNTDFEIKISGNSYADYNNRQLTFTVKNIGQTEAWPACWVEVSSPDKKYSAQDYITWNTPLASGDTKYFDGQMPVSGGGAYATQSKVTCSTDPSH